MQQVFIVRTVYFNQLVTMPLHSSCRLCLRYMSRTQLATYKAWKTCHLHTHANIDGWSLYRPELFLERGGWAVLGIACGRVSNVSCVQPYPWPKRVRRCEEWVQRQHSRHAQPASFVSCLRPFPRLEIGAAEARSGAFDRYQCESQASNIHEFFSWDKFLMMMQQFCLDFGIFWWKTQKQSKTLKTASNKNILHSSCSVHFVGPEESCHIYSGQCNAACLWDRAGSSPHIAASLIQSKIRRSKRCW